MYLEEWKLNNLHWNPQMSFTVSLEVTFADFSSSLIFAPFLFYRLWKDTCQFQMPVDEAVNSHPTQKSLWIALLTMSFAWDSSTEVVTSWRIIEEHDYKIPRKEFVFPGNTIHVLTGWKNKYDWKKSRLLRHSQKYYVLQTVEWQKTKLPPVAAFCWHLLSLCFADFGSRLIA